VHASYNPNGEEHKFKENHQTYIWSLIVTKKTFGPLITSFVTQQFIVVFIEYSFLVQEKGAICSDL
jgi:hypothetical protein